MYEIPAVRDNSTYLNVNIYSNDLVLNSDHANLVNVDVI